MEDDMDQISMKNQMQSMKHNEVECISGGMNKHTTTRFDKNGNQIKQKRERQPNGQKKRLAHKLTFADEVAISQGQDTKGSLEQIIQVESYKKYNMETSHNDNGCCTIF